MKLLLTASVILATSIAFAQAPTPQPPASAPTAPFTSSTLSGNPHSIPNRKENQQDRIASGGRLIVSQRASINQRQNRASGQIYRQKHNASRQRS
jgi:hypothetical protein